MRPALILLAAAGLVWAQTAAPKPVLGTVTAFRVEALEFGVTPDGGAPVLVKVGPETEVVTIPPGERGLEKAKPAKVTDIELGDRVLVSFVEGLEEARRIVLMPAGEIARRNEAERLDWQQRGVSGIVAARNGDEIALEQRTPQGVKKTAIRVTEKTRIRRYAPDSVKFTDAQPSTAGEIAPGDQVQARGRKNEDGREMAAEEIVFGTFLSKVGAVLAVNVEAGEIRMEDLATKKVLTVRVTAGSRLKSLPDMKTMFAAMIQAGKAHAAEGHAAEGHANPANFDLKQMLEQLPPCRLEDVKAGSTMVVTSTRGANSDQLTAILLLANADGLIQMAQSGHPGTSPVDAISSLHGGMLAGPGGLSLPAILQ